MTVSAAKRHGTLAMRKAVRSIYGAADPNEGVIGAAVLVATAFRLRDPDGLASALKLLASAVDDWEQSERASSFR